MTPCTPRAAKLLAELRRDDITLAPKGDRLAFDAPAGTMTPAVQTMLRARKPELLAVLRGDYLNAAAALLLGVPDPEQRAELACQLDERAGICEYEGGMSRGEAEHIAYRELARAVEARNEADATAKKAVAERTRLGHGAENGFVSKRPAPARESVGNT